MRRRKAPRPPPLPFLTGAFPLLLLFSGGWLPPNAADTAPGAFAETRLPGNERVAHPVGWAVQGRGEKLILLGHDTGEAIVAGSTEGGGGNADVIARTLLAKASVRGPSPVVTDTFRLGPNLFLEAFARSGDGFESMILVLVCPQPSVDLSFAGGAGGDGEISPALHAVYSGPPEHYDARRVGLLLMRVVSSLEEQRGVSAVSGARGEL